MGYAIVFLFLVGLITSGVLFVASTHKRIQVLFQSKEHVLLDNLLTLRMASNIQDEGSFVLPHVSGDSSRVSVKKWGVFQAVSVKTWHGFQQVERSSVSAPIYYGPDYSFYLPQTRDELKLCGDARLEGIIHIPDYGLKRGHLAGKDFTGDKLFYGDQKPSENTLPELQEKYKSLSLEHFLMSATKKDFGGKDSSFSFHEPTTLYSSMEAQIVSGKLAGNVILHSFDSLVVSKEASLEHVILIAPKIYFEEGFQGTVQAIAHRSIICGKGVRLNYPSVLILNEFKSQQTVENHHITLNEDCRVLGGILLTSEQLDYRNPVRLKAEKSLIAGFVYNEGETDLQGEIAGTLVTQAISLKYGGGQYRNYLMDVKISKSNLPREFIVPNWLKGDRSSKSALLACF